MEYSYRAIVLGKRDIADVDRLYTFYSLEGGLLCVSARGVRKVTAKLAAHLETFVEAHVLVARRRGSGTIISAVTENAYPVFRRDVLALGELFWVADQFLRMVSFDDVDERLFFLYRSFLSTVEDISARSGLSESRRGDLYRLISLSFLFHTLSLLGYDLSFLRCAVSGKSLSSCQSSCVFSPALGVVACGEYSGSFSDAIVVSDNTIKLLRLFANNSFSSLMRLHVDQHDLAQARRVYDTFFLWHFS
ncbi:MAG: DNA repair protein RecO [Candidatus Moranbacteria bacterium]|nr:DNA repair protein RecO [Candidatus Moranbacteria bacterium]